MPHRTPKQKSRTERVSSRVFHVFLYSFVNGFFWSLLPYLLLQNFSSILNYFSRFNCAQFGSTKKKKKTEAKVPEKSSPPWTQIGGQEGPLQKYCKL